MKRFFYSFIILKLLIPIFPVIPLWNFESSTFDLLMNISEYSYSLYKKIVDNKKIEIIKNITISNNKISEINTLSIDSYEKEVEWEDIESSYSYSNNIYICPKGKFHLYIYNG